MSNQKDQTDQSLTPPHIASGRHSPSELAAVHPASIASLGQAPFPMSFPVQYPVEQPTFNDLMRELRHEESDALHAAARQASFQAGPVASQNLQSAGTSSAPRTDTRGMGSSYSGDFSSSPLVSSRPSPVSTHSTPPNQAGSWQQANPKSEEQAGEFEMFPCDICSASFSRRHDLDRHRRAHSGEAPYPCLGCGSAFTRSDGRGRHWKLQPDCEQRHYQLGGTGRKNARGGSGTGASHSGGGSGTATA
ncbi:hypothetical protein FRC17_001695 [Serendipita sp. 399]|nr:hypothetical protein FRC17_001695 [Serendipita sp. 399]